MIEFIIDIFKFIASNIFTLFATKDAVEKLDDKELEDEKKKKLITWSIIVTIILGAIFYFLDW
jgi:hypothetical protein